MSTFPNFFNKKKGLTYYGKRKLYSENLIKKHFYDWEHDKEDNILTYRDKSFSSPVTGSVAPIHHTQWAVAMDDSLKAFLDQPKN